MPRKRTTNKAAKKAARKAAKKQARRSDPSRFILGFDSEWVRQDETTNRILSYQCWIIAGDRQGGGIFFVRDLDKPRLEFSDFIGRALEAGKRKGLFAQYPRALTLVAHFSLADLVALDDFEEAVRCTFENVRKTYVSLQKPEEISFKDSNRHKHSVDVTLRDSKLIAPAGSKLEDIGVLHDIPKIQLPDGMIEQMDKLLERDEELFTRYAIKDAQIAAVHADRMAEQYEALCGRRKIPVSLGGMAIDYCLTQWLESGISPLDVLGREEVEHEIYNPRTGRYRTVKEEVPLREVHENEAFVVETYHGGRNEAFEFGATAEGIWRDIDLVGAYPTAMASIGMLDWSRMRMTTDLDDFTHEAIGFARVRFDFPTWVRFPGLPVRTDNNLIFPKSGEAYVTAAEIAVAREQDCEIEILKGLVIPADENVQPIFTTVKRATESRNEAKARGNDLEQKLFKELINSFYGKFAQGLRKKRVFSTTEGETQEMEPSRVTQPYIAAQVTGRVRAILSEIMNALPGEYSVVSVTTDGFITDAPEEVTAAASDGPLCRLFKRARKALVGDETILEDKHEVGQVLCWRTRGQATLKVGEGENPILLAKAGLRAPYGLDNSEQNRWIIDEFLNRRWNTRFTSERLRGLRSIYDEGGDLVSEQHTQRLNMDFDFKRRVDRRTLGTRRIRDQDHVRFRTLPWKTVEDYLACRGVRSAFVTDEKRVLRTREDVTYFEEILSSRLHLPKGVNHSKSKGLRGDAIRLIIRAMIHDQWNLSLKGRSYRTWTDWFNAAGDTWVNVSTFKRAKGAGPAPDHAVELNAESAGVKLLMQREFPDFDFNRFLVGKPAPKSAQDDRLARLLGE